MKFDSIEEHPNLTGSEKTFFNISSGQTSSNIVNCFGFGMTQLFVPDNFTAANLTFQVSDDGNTWYDSTLTDGTQVNITASAGKAYFLGAIFFGIQYIKINASVAQSAAISLKAQLSPIYGKI